MQPVGLKLAAGSHMILPAMYVELAPIVLHIIPSSGVCVTKHALVFADSWVHWKWC